MRSEYLYFYRDTDNCFFEKRLQNVSWIIEFQADMAGPEKILLCNMHHSDMQVIINAWLPAVISCEEIGGKKHTTHVNELCPHLQMVTE